MILCEYCQKFYCRELSELVELPVSRSQCEKCIERNERLLAQEAENKANVFIFLKNIANIERSKGWKNALISKIIEQQ